MAYRVCIVDDEPWAAIDAMNSIDWQRFGFEFTKHYSSAMEALNEIPLKNYTLILVDISMPAMDGLELIRRLQEARVQAQFAILSGYSDFEYARAAIRLGVRDYFVKPLEPDEIHHYLSTFSPAEPESSEPTLTVTPQFSEILEYIDAHLSGKLTLDTVANSLGYNKNYICHLFQKNIGQTYVQYLTHRRIEHAKHLLAHTTASLYDVATQCGFSDYAYFTRVFKRELKQTPTEYRKTHHK
ncbi:MAG: helix-turn-helix domain-containing protein [Clostridia bacterium]|nr:helix-turn-helix domain-containing protein [Clostridia bacterium]